MRNKTTIALIVLACAACLVLLAPGGKAQADEAAAPGYLLGTTLVLHSAVQLSTPPSGWWGDLLPVEYRFGICYIVDAINASRAARGEGVKIDVAKYPITIGSEMPVEGGWDYTIDFQGMQPADIEAALAKFPLSGACAGMQHSFREVGNGYYYAESTTDTLTLDVIGHKLTVHSSDSFAAMREKLLVELQKIFGPAAKFDLTLSMYDNAYMGSTNFNVNVSVYLNGTQPMMDEEAH